MTKYIHQHKKWPDFSWDVPSLCVQLANIHHCLGRLLGRMEGLGFALQEEALLRSLSLEIVKSSEIENEKLDLDQVRSSVARKLGIETAGLVEVTDRYIDGTVDMMLDATQHFNQPLSEERLFNWHAALFPTGRSGIYPIIVADWRSDGQGPMQVISEHFGRERIHYEAPEAARVPKEMAVFFKWFNQGQHSDPLIKAAIAHLWFVTIHPFEDGNGRIARAIADLQLARVDGSKQRFYSMSAQIRKERKTYYAVLEKTQKGGMDVTEWLQWFLACLERALLETEISLKDIIAKAHFWEKHKDVVFNQRQQFILNKLLDGGFLGKLNTTKWSKMTKCSHDTALRDIQDLINKQVLKKEPAGGRSTSYTLS